MMIMILTSFVFVAVVAVVAGVAVVVVVVVVVVVTAPFLFTAATMPNSNATLWQLL